MNNIPRNPGKIFEDSFCNSLPEYVLVKRLNDNAAGWSGGSNTRFASNNECDFILFNDKTQYLYALELKSTKDNSLTYWKKEYETKGKSFQIRKCQILGLQKFSKYKHCICGFLINFRAQNNTTYFINIKNFLNYTSSLSKKSISIHDIQKMNPIEIKSTIKRTNYKYDTENFLREVEYKYDFG